MGGALGTSAACEVPWKAEPSCRRFVASVELEVARPGGVLGATAGFAPTVHAVPLSWSVVGAGRLVGVTALARLKASEESFPLAGDGASGRARGRGFPGREHRRDRAPNERDRTVAD
ncbi:hypothetical protein GCM10010303_29150 [Streptomyces purpurascens]|nr:hypothetical protein GCM10010303_29150 [Streptomyces purpurascens]